jgi:DNA-binding transcriptional LysR family regulator
MPSTNRLAAMETFVRVLDAGSFSGAAKQLKIGQPAVSKSVAQLEQRLGVRLLMRSTNGVSPTEAGRKFYDHARLAIEEADQADMAARGAGASLAGRLRINVGVALGKLHVVPLLPSFLAAHPDLSVDLILDDRSINLIEEGVDIGLWLGPLADSSLSARKVATSRRLVLGAPAYFERAGIPESPAELNRHAAVIYTQDRGGTDNWTFRQHASSMSVSMSGRLRVSASEGLRAAVLGGMGLAITPEWMFAEELESGTVRTILDEWTLPPSEMWAVFASGRMANAKARAFAALLETELGKAPFGAHGGSTPAARGPQALNDHAAALELENN